MIKINILLWGVLVVFLHLEGSPRAVCAQGTPEPAAEPTAAGIPYVSGGIGLDEREALRAVSSEYNLHVTFARREGNYLSDVHVAIQNAQGATIFEATPQGPWLFTKLLPGKYTVVANRQGKAQQRLTHVPTVGHAEVYFYW